MKLKFRKQRDIMWRKLLGILTLFSFLPYFSICQNKLRENGWYHIEILGGETLQDGDYEPTFEFVIQPATNEEVTINADMNFSFEITSSAY